MKRFILSLSVAACLSAALTLPAFADFDKGWAAYESKQYSEALREFNKAAQQGDTSAQFNLGVMYANGRGVPQDHREAVKWFRLAAEQGHALAQNNLGVMYEEGRGVPQDHREAVKWYRLAAEQGHARAQNNLGVMYEEGRGVPQDHREAVKWYRLAAEQGYALAQFNLGLIYANGQGVPQDHREAIKWYRLAAEQGHASAQNNLGVMYANGQGVPQDHREAIKWYRLAAEQGYTLAQNNLMLIHANDQGVLQDHSVEDAQGDATAHNNLWETMSEQLLIYGFLAAVAAVIIHHLFFYKEKTTTDSTAQTSHKPSDIWLMKIWIYIILPIFPLGVLGFSFFGEAPRGSLNGEQFIFITICAALIYGLHKKQKWAWYFNWIGLLALAAIPLKFGAVGGALGVLWIWWNYLAWKRLKQIFAF